MNVIASDTITDTPPHNQTQFSTISLHGHPRNIKDLDILIWINESNAKMLIATLKEFGFTVLDLKPDDFLISGNVIQLGYPPTRIDLLTSVDGVDFDSCYFNNFRNYIFFFNTVFTK